MRYRHRAGAERRARRPARTAARRPGVAGRAALAAALVTGSAACLQERPHEIVVSAASDLALAMPELAAGFEAAYDVEVVTNLGSSGQLAQQILRGAPVDVFMAADDSWIERLQRAGRVTEDEIVVYATGRLVLYGAEGADGGADLTVLLQPTVRRVAIANPEHAPYGRAARQALERAGLWGSLQSKLVLAESVRQALQYADAGSGTVALVAYSLMREGDRYRLLPDSGHAPLRQTLAVIADGPNPEAGRAFMRYIAGEEGRTILERYNLVMTVRP
jgi:molybdate transport system substrate-binding protein